VHPHDAGGDNFPQIGEALVVGHIVDELRAIARGVVVHVCRT
jgi:hypothetical protein